MVAERQNRQVGIILFGLSLRGHIITAVLTIMPCLLIEYPLPYVPPCIHPLHVHFPPCAPSFHMCLPQYVSRLHVSYKYLIP